MVLLHKISNFNFKCQIDLSNLHINISKLRLYIKILKFYSKIQL